MNTSTNTTPKTTSPTTAATNPLMSGVDDSSKGAPPRAGSSATATRKRPFSRSKSNSQGKRKKRRQQMAKYSNPSQPFLMTVERQEQDKRLTTLEMYNICKPQVTPDSNHIFRRHEQESCHELDELDRSAPLNAARPKLPNGSYFKCYGCNRPCRQPHAVYLYSCFACGQTNQTHRHLTRDLTGQTAVVTGARTKLGHQIALKLLRAGATVFGTTRRPGAAQTLFQAYPDSSQWMNRLELVQADFDTTHVVRDAIQPLLDKIGDRALDILVNCAAQTIRARDKPSSDATKKNNETNRYGDDKFVDQSHVNSWKMRVEDVSQGEMEEVLRVNAVAPVLLVQQCLPLLQKSTQKRAYVINVHAREGRFQTNKDDQHIHTNLGKAGLAMLTKCLAARRHNNNNNNKASPKISVHGVDPGWISIDEYYEDNLPWVVPPLDEVDGAARILYPLWKELSSNQQTRVHFDTLTY